MISCRRLCVFFLALFSHVGSAQATTLSFLADLNIPMGAKVGGTVFGGLSGLSYDPIANALLLISDDKSEHQAARYYTVRIDVSPGRLRFDPLYYKTLLRRDGTPFPKADIDPEAIVILDDRRLFVSSEGNSRSDPRVMPAIFEFDGKGRVAQSLAIPEKYLPESRGKQTHGIVENCAFESLTLTPSNSSLFAATECPLIQDDTPADFRKGGLSRILQYHLQGSHRIPGAEYLYLTEPNSKPKGAIADYGNGISEMLALNERQLLVIERGVAGTSKGAFDRIRIFKATLGISATNVAGLDSIKGRNVRPVKKELILDLNSILPELTPKWRSLDNIEGMTFGPTLPNGNRTLILVSDDNFNPLQRTQILAFEISEE